MLLITLSVALFVCRLSSGQETKTGARIYSLHIQSDILFRYSTTLVTSRLANPHNQSAEATFTVTLPNEAFISNFTLEIDGEIFLGEVKDKASAKKQYDKAKRKGHSAGHVGRARETNQFKVAVNIAAFSKVTFNLTYQELLQRRRGVYRHRLYIEPKQPVKDMKITVRIQESRPLTVLNVRPIQNDLLTNDYTLGKNQLAIVDRPSPETAFVTFSPSIEDQTVNSTTGISGQFIVEYDIGRSLDAGDLLVVNGYFVHFIAPEVKEAIPKDIIFIIDTSGSMSGESIYQVKASMESILQSLQEGDRFNVMEFASSTKLYRNHMLPVNGPSISKATKFVRQLTADGGTNIYEAIVTGLQLLNQTDALDDERRTKMIVFLTDGDASTGITDDNLILNYVKEENEDDIPIFTLGYGSGADWDLLKKLALQSNAVAKRIYKDSDASLQIASFYDELAVTLLQDVKIKYIDDVGTPLNVTSSGFKNYYSGSEMVVAGKIGAVDARTLNLELTSIGAEGAITLTPESNLNVIDLTSLEQMTTLSDISTITEKLWAYLTIKKLLNEVEKSSDKTRIDELRQQALDLSLKYQFVTPLTSMVVTKPDSEEDEDEYKVNTAPEPTTTTRPYYNKRRGGGRSRGYGGGGGGYGGGGGGDPHYILRLPGFEHPICFDVKSSEEEVQNILTDPNKHVVLNAQIIQSNMLDSRGDKKTFIGQLSITTKHHVIVITPEIILFDTKVHDWATTFQKTFGNNTILVSNKGHVTIVTFKDGAQFVVSRHLKQGREQDAVNFLSMYINHEDGFSKRSTGLLGQFVNGHKQLILKNQFKNESGRTVAKIQIKELGDVTSGNHDNLSQGQRIRKVVRATLVPKPHILDNGSEFCWMVHQPFVEAFIGTRQSFTGTHFLAVF